jgi:ABC-type branched-subunit amino acid transport system substrate-binding protein
MRPRGLVSISAILFSAAVLSSVSAWAQESIKVGVLTIRSGPGAPVGDDILTGIQTATRLQGAVLGRPVELIVEDSLWNPQQAVTKATKLVQQNRVVAILGTSTIEALALLPVADRLGVPIVTSNAGAAAITRARCSRWVFRTNPDELMSVASLKHLITQTPALQNAKWFTIGHDYPWSRLVGGSVKSVKDLKYAGETFAPLDTTDWAPFIAQARTAGATAIVMPVTLGTPLLQFIQQAQEFGLTRDAVLVSPIGLPDWLVDKLGETSTRVVSAGSWAAWRHEESEPATKQFNEAFHRQHGRVAGMQSLQAGAATMMLYAAIARAGSVEPGEIVRGLEAVEVRTPVGPLKFQAGGRQAESPLFLGPYEPLNPPRYGARFAQRAEAFPAARSLPMSARESGCTPK